MDRYEKPMLWLCQEAGNGESDAMAITGGEDVYHAQIADSNGRWVQALNPSRGTECMNVWTSDQGFSPEARFTWNLEETLEIARWYLERGTPLPEIHWSSP